jgi:hypothetical protein
MQSQYQDMQVHWRTGPPYYVYSMMLRTCYIRLLSHARGSVTGDSGCAMDPDFNIRKPWIQDYFHGCVTSAWDVPLGVPTAFKTIFNASFIRSILDIGVIVYRRRFTGLVAVFCWYCHVALLLLLSLCYVTY